MPKRHIALAAVSAVALFTIGPAATAGTAADPEVTDTCDDGYVNVSGDSMFPPDATNPLAAWFRGIWEPGEDEPVLKALEITLQVCDDMDFVPPTPDALAAVAYSVKWLSGNCTQSVRLIRSFTVPKRVDARQTCGAGPTDIVTLPDADSRIEADRLIVTLHVDGPATTVLDGLVDGQSLVMPQATSWWVLSTDGGGSGNSSVGIDESEIGRTFRIGQDKPGS